MIRDSGFQKGTMIAMGLRSLLVLLCVAPVTSPAGLASSGFDIMLELVDGCSFLSDAAYLDSARLLESAEPSVEDKTISCDGRKLNVHYIKKEAQEGNGRNFAGMIIEW